MAVMDTRTEAVDLVVEGHDAETSDLTFWVWDAVDPNTERLSTGEWWEQPGNY